MLTLSAVPITRQRRTAQTMGTDGRPVAQVPTSTTILATVLPADSSMTCTDPGYSGQLRRRLHSFSELLIADETTGRPADRVVLSDGTYLVWWTSPFPGVGPIAAHWEAEVYRLQVLSPPAGVAPVP